MSGLVQVLGVPGARLYTVLLAATAGNVAALFSPGAGKRWLVLDLVITIVCDGTAANRTVILEPQTSAGVRIGTGFSNATAYTSGQTRRMGLTRSLVRTIDSNLQELNSLVAAEWFVDGTNKINISVTNGQAGDSYSGFITVLEV